MTERVIVTGGSGFIGSHLIEAIAARNIDAINIDINPPSVHDQESYWRQCDVKDVEALATLFQTFLPTRVIHLAAKANLVGETVDDFPDNTLGTANIVEAVNKTESVKMFVNTSTQYVVRPGVLPDDDSYFEPYTAYGESKALAEKLVRHRCRRPWVIIRPTNIWGPRHPFYPHELWRYLERGYYVHPGFSPIYKHYGYVSNAVEQMLLIALSEPAAGFGGTVRYITDGAIDNADWMNGFSLGLRHKRLRRVPLPLWRMMALVGDLLKGIGVKLPVNSDRLFRLTVTEQLPASKLLTLPDEIAISFQEGIRRSVNWYRAAEGQRVRPHK